MRLVNYCPNISMETIFVNTKNSKTNDLRKFVFNLSQIVYLRKSNSHVTLQNLSIYYTRKNVRQQYKNNKLKIIAPMLFFKGCVRYIFASFFSSLKEGLFEI